MTDGRCVSVSSINFVCSPAALALILNGMLMTGCLRSLWFIPLWIDRPRMNSTFPFRDLLVWDHFSQTTGFPIESQDTWAYFVICESLSCGIETLFSGLVSLATERIDPFFVQWNIVITLDIVDKCKLSSINCERYKMATANQTKAACDEYDAVDGR